MWSCKDRTGTNFLEKLGVVDYSGFDSGIYIAVRNKTLKAKVVKLPFYKK